MMKRLILVFIVFFCSASSFADTDDDLNFNMGGFNASGSGIANSEVASTAMNGTNVQSCDCESSINSASDDVKKKIIEDFAKPNYKALVLLIEEINNNTRELRNRTKLLKREDLKSYTSTSLNRAINTTSQINDTALQEILVTIKKKKALELNRFKSETIKGSIE